jgi:hypothetical protein
MLVLAAFALERITKGAFFLLSFTRPWKDIFPEPSTVAGAEAKYQAERKLRLAYFVFCGVLALLVVVLSPEFRVLSAMDINGPTIVDFALTWLVLLAGSDRIQELMQDRKGAATVSSSKPIQIEGTVTLLDAPEPRAQRGAR